MQVYQKIISPYLIQYASSGLFNQAWSPTIFRRDLETLYGHMGKVKEISKQLDGVGENMSKEQGGLGLKDRRIQGITLAMKWITKATIGNGT